MHVNQTKNWSTSFRMGERHVDIIHNIHSEEGEVINGSVAPIRMDKLDLCLAVLSAIRNADRLGRTIEDMVMYCGYVCNRIDEYGKLMVLSYLSPYSKMGDYPMYDLSTCYSYKVGEVITVGFDYMHLIKEVDSPPTILIQK